MLSFVPDLDNLALECDSSQCIITSVWPNEHAESSCVCLLLRSPSCTVVTLRLLGCIQAGATAVVPETLEPSLQLASAVLSQLNMPQDEVAHAIQAFRRNHISELQV